MIARWHDECCKRYKIPHEPTGQQDVSSESEAVRLARSLAKTIYVDWHNERTRFLVTADGRIEGPWLHAKVRTTDL